MRVKPSVRSVLYGSFIGLICLILISPIFIINVPPPPKTKIVKEISGQYRATCKIRAGEQISTGVLLDTGFVLACAHAIDLNKDYIVQKNERKVTLIFGDGFKKFSLGGRVVLFGEDYSIIQPDRPIVSNIKISLAVPLIGEPLYTLGYPKGFGIHLTKGYQSSKSSGGRLERTSISAYMGNSGGGIFTKEGKSAGVLKLLGAENITICSHGVVPIPMPSLRKIRAFNVHSHAEYMRVIPSWTEYTPTVIIYREVARRGLGFTLIKPINKKENKVDRVIIKTFLQIFTALFAVGLFRVELFD